MSQLIPRPMKWLLALIGLSLLGYGAVQAQNQWQIGAIVGLRAGTCIREGPGFSYRAHTRVPEDDWAVRVIDGPRLADGKVWWDTSRRAAGDPSGGTGWVTEDQTDTDCPLPTAPEPPIPAPSPAESSWLAWIVALWHRLPDWAQWSTAVVLLLVALRMFNRTADYLLALLGALLSSAFLWIIMDLTRQFWQPLWNSLAHSLFTGNPPDLALLVALLPLASWGLSTVRRLLRRV